MKTKEHKLHYEKPVMRVYNMKQTRIICNSEEDFNPGGGIDD
jgi:hypothetical protein